MKEESGPEGRAEYSDDERYRYWLERWFPENLFDPRASVHFVMLNPSTATAFQDDPTIRRCRSFSKPATRVVITNLFSFRSTNPTGMLSVDDPGGGRDNDLALKRAIDTTDRVVVAWGALGALWLQARARARVGLVIRMADQLGKELLCLGTCKNGQPRHPLYVSGRQELIPWDPKLP